MSCSVIREDTTSRTTRPSRLETAGVMRFRFAVEVEVEREEGKFASRDELADELREAIEQADPGSVEGGNGGVYNVIVWEVTDGG
jgi:hypothetical protein